MTKQVGDTSSASTWVGVRLSPRGKKFVALVLSTLVFGAVFHPMAFIFDTYDYLFRSMHIHAYGGHPFLFGLLLRVLAALSHPLPVGGFSQLVTAWQLWCVGVLGYVCLDGRWPIRWPSRVYLAVPLIALCLVTVLFVIAPMLYLTNGYHSEPTAFALLALSVAAFARAVEARSSVGRWLAFGTLCLIGYHVRYQHIVVPLAAGLTLLVRFVLRRTSLRDLIHHGVVIAAIVVTIPASQRVLAAMFPVAEYGLRHHEVFLRKSIQCSIGCSVRMFETSCESEKGRRLLDGAPCWQVLGIPEHELGSAYPKPAGMAGTLLSLDTATLFEFLIKAPLLYLQQHQGDPLHITGFSFNRQVHWFSEHVPEVLEHYGHYFPEGEAEPSPAFDAVLKHLEERYAAGWYHGLTAAALYVSCVAIFLSRDLTSACLYATTIGTFFLMAYVQPQFPLRYSMHIALPALLAAFRDALRLLMPKRDEPSEPPRADTSADPIG